ncbi:lyase family protein [Gordonia phthalatica]|uniref:Fumarate lyase N-terminal domain-containing protein n=1 Tax=Gordonia phthalatica TaxID=1136941 RepID=A0A0N9NEI5_9ACTN|nr:lyase family protein [Gordonia phthalatica]ALG86124.1 hypothetical protein ACH46_18535 [Gordonia phthalatica]
MTDLLWPGMVHADGLFGDRHYLEAMVAVEQAWLDALVEVGVAPDRGTDLRGLVDEIDLADIARDSEPGGNPAQPVVTLLRERSSNGWVHRGLTSQDVVDTALILCARAAVHRLLPELRDQVSTLVDLADRYRGALMPGRTLTQHAVPITFGLKAANWLTGVVASAERTAALGFPVQIGGAAGTLSAAVELTGSATTAREAVGSAAAALGLDEVLPWHTMRSPITAIGDALVSATDAWGVIAADVTAMSRSGSRIVSDATPGGSSTMPHKQNPTRAVLIRRAAIANPPLGQTLHAAAALAVDERPDGAWHVEWPMLADLARRTVVAGVHTSQLLSGLRVDDVAMARQARSAWSDLTAERTSIASFVGTEPSDGDYLGLTDFIVDRALAEATAFLERNAAPIYKEK